MGDIVPISDKLRAAREDLLGQHLDALNRGDIDAVLASYARPRIELVASGRVFDGPDAVRSYLADRKRWFPDQRFEPICLHHSDHAVISEHWLSGTHLGEIQGVEPSGRRFKARMAAIFEFDGEALINTRLYYDTGTIARQLA